MSPRFPLFAAASLALHAGFFVPALVAPRAPPTAAGGDATGTGGTAAVAGETFDVPELDEPPPESAGADETIEIDRDPAPTGATAPTLATSESAAPETAPSAGAGATSTTRATTARASRPHRAPAAPAAPPPPPPLYGAVGDRAAGDLVVAFTRLFSSTGSSDARWGTIPIGFSAAAEVTFALGADGLLQQTSVSASAPIFRDTIQHVLTALKHRTFTARGAATRLHMVVRVTDELTNHGAFTIDAAGSFELASGRHVGVKVTER